MVMSSRRKGRGCPRPRVHWTTERLDPAMHPPIALRSLYRGGQQQNRRPRPGTGEKADDDCAEERKGTHHGERAAGWNEKLQNQEYKAQEQQYEGPGERSHRDNLGIYFSHDNSVASNFFHDH